MKFKNYCSIICCIIATFIVWNLSSGLISSTSTFGCIVGFIILAIWLFIIIRTKLFTDLTMFKRRRNNEEEDE